MNFDFYAIFTNPQNIEYTIRHQHHDSSSLFRYTFKTLKELCFIIFRVLSSENS